MSVLARWQLAREEQLLLVMMPVHDGQRAEKGAGLGDVDRLVDGGCGDHSGLDRFDDALWLCLLEHELDSADALLEYGGCRVD